MKLSIENVSSSKFVEIVQSLQQHFIVRIEDQGGNDINGIISFEEANSSYKMMIGDRRHYVSDIISLLNKGSLNLIAAAKDEHATVNCIPDTLYMATFTSPGYAEDDRVFGVALTRERAQEECDQQLAMAQRCYPDHPKMNDKQSYNYSVVEVPFFS